MSIEAMKLALKALHNIDQSNNDDAITTLRQAIEQAEQAQPVAWKDKTYGNLHHHDYGNSIPLYTVPPPRKPLTDEQMYLAIRPLFRTDALATSALQISKDEYRAIEAAHGIKGEA
jgi:hypothetical protein